MNESIIIYNKRRGRICLPRRNFPSEIAAILSVKTGDRLSKPYRQWWKFTLQQKSASCFSAGCAQNRLWIFSGKWDKFGTFRPKIACFFAILYRSYDIKLVDGLHRGDWVRQFYVSLYIPPKPVAAAFFRLRGVMYLYITYYISIRIWCQYWCQWCQTLSRHQIFQKCSARSVPSIPSVLPHRFPLSFWCPCGPWLPESL